MRKYFHIAGVLGVPKTLEKSARDCFSDRLWAARDKKFDYRVEQKVQPSSKACVFTMLVPVERCNVYEAGCAVAEARSLNGWKVGGPESHLIEKGCIVTLPQVEQMAFEISCGKYVDAHLRHLDPAAGLKNELELKYLLFFKTNEGMYTLGVAEVGFNNGWRVTFHDFDRIRQQVTSSDRIVIPNFIILA